MLKGNGAMQQLIESVKHIGTLKHFSVGGEVYRPLAERGEVFFIESGTVEFYEVSYTGRKIILETLGAGSFFGDLCESEEPCAWLNNFADAKPGTVLYRLRTKDFLQLISDQPAIALQVIDDISQQLRRAETKIKHFALSDAATRLMAELISYARKYGEESDCCVIIPRHLTHQQIAEMAGLARETTTMLLNRFKRQRIIEIDTDRTIVIHKKNFPKIF